MDKYQKNIITITDSAINKIKKMMSENKDNSIGIRIFVTTQGCTGLSYSMEYVNKKDQFDEEINEQGIKLFVDSKAIMYIIGTEMDYKENKLVSGFFFKNPNEKGRCGCGESFHV